MWLWLPFPLSSQLPLNPLRDCNETLYEDKSKYLDCIFQGECCFAIFEGIVALGVGVLSKILYMYLYYRTHMYLTL
jgi:hypothetical protein